MTRPVLSFAGAALASVLALATPAQALTMQECSAKYKAAQAAGGSNGLKWSDFRKAQCGAEVMAAAPAAEPGAAPAEAATAANASAPAPSASAGNAAFPTAVSPKYANETAGRARMHTCLDQYKANKATNGNAGLAWIAKGGGYYSECSKRLKS